MGAHMRCDGGTLRETSIADGALERLFSAVCPQVSGQVSRLCKGLLANGTLVGLFTAMGSQVCLQRRLPCVGLATNVA